MSNLGVNCLQFIKNMEVNKMGICFFDWGKYKTYSFDYLRKLNEATKTGLLKDGIVL